MNCMKVTRALVAAVSLAAIAFATGCNPAGVSDNASQNKASVFVTPTITISSTNIALTTNQIVQQDTENIQSIVGGVPYVPVLLSKLMENGTSPYVTFTFNKAVESVYGVSSAAGNDTATDKFIYDVNVGGTTATVKEITRIDGLGSSTIKFVLPPYATNKALMSDDNKTFVVGNKYYIDFYVKMADGDTGRISVGFMPVLAKTDIGAFGDSNISLYKDSTDGQAQYALYLIDAARVFFLNKGSPATHTANATPDEKIVVGVSTITTFTDYANRLGNGTAYGGVANPTYGSLDALPNHGRTTDYVRLRWTLAANATSYDVYTTSNKDLTKDWIFIESITLNLTTYTKAYYDYDFNLWAYPITTGSRAVRIIPRLGNYSGNPGQIILKDTVCPITTTRDNDLGADSFAVGNQTYTDHTHGNAAIEGEFVAVGVKYLNSILTNFDTNPEGHQATGVIGTLTVGPTTATNGVILGLSIAEFQAYLTAQKVTLTKDQSLVSLGGNAVGIFNKANGSVTVYVHLKCNETSGGTIAYTSANTPITGTITPTYADASGNLMITRSVAGTSRNDGTLVMLEN